MIESRDKEDLSKQGKKNMKTFIMNLRLDFSEQEVVYTYFTLFDIVALLGGLLATFKSISA